MTENSGDVHLFDFPSFKLRLYQPGNVPGSRQDDDAAGVGVKSMSRSRRLRLVDFAQDELKRVSIESATRVHR